MMISVLFARSDSIYKSLNCDVWDINRDARNWPGGNPVVAHPPCRAWGRLRHFARPRADEKELAIWAVKQVRENGGILEHPSQSTLWEAAGLPSPGQSDGHGGYTLWISQWWFGHRADKATWLYIVGCVAENLPQMPFKIGEPSHVVQSRKRQGHKPHISKAEREHTPVELAKWLIETASRCEVKR
jgi:hypothetical protein